MSWYDRHIGFDFETSGRLPEYGLQPWRVAHKLSWVTSMVWIVPGERVHSSEFLPDADFMRRMLEYAIANDRRIVGWNVTFDIQWLIAYGLRDLVFRAKWLDGMLVWKHFAVEPEHEAKPGKRKSFSLKPFVAEHFPDFAGYENGVDYHSTDPEKVEALLKYNVDDVVFTLKGTKMYWDKLTPKQRKAALIEAECLPMVADTNLRGMLVDTPTLRSLRADLAWEAKVELEALSPHGVDEKVIRSPQKLRKVLFEDWGLEPLKETEASTKENVLYSTDKETLHELAISSGDWRVKAVRNYRESLNAIGKYCDSPLEAAEYNGDGYARPQFFVFSTYTGRFTVASFQGKNKDKRQTGFALHQEKRDKRFREKIIAPGGYTLVEADAIGQEFRWMAELSKDPVMRALCAPGEDAHSYMGSRIDPDWEYHQLMAAVKAAEKAAENLRKSGKVGNLSLQYRTSAPRFCSTARVDYGIDMRMNEAIHIHGLYPLTYKRMPTYWDKQILKVKHDGYVETLAGRRVTVKGDWSRRSKMRWALESTAINYPVQGVGAEQKYLAMACTKDVLNEFDARFMMDLHDGIYWLVPDAKVGFFVDRVQEVLDNLPYTEAWDYTPSIPLPWEIKTGPSWGTLKEWKG